MSVRLSAGDVQAALAALPGWSERKGMLVRTMKLPSFPLALAAVVAVGATAQAMNHHPDIDIRYRTLTFNLSSHDVGGISARDVALAQEFSKILDAGLGSQPPG